jgi:4-hydroxybenzoate polyprenyltransferase
LSTTETPISTPPSSTTSSWAAWAQLVRLPNVFTVIADVSAAYLLVSGGPDSPLQFVIIVLAGVSLYWAGMILNDVFDVDRDRSERPSRPIPAGLIPLPRATAAGWALLGAGVLLAAICGYLPDGSGITWLPAAVAVLLAIAIVAYDGPLKKTPLAPAAMGSCRLLSFLLGAAPAVAGAAEGSIFPSYVLCIAAGFGIYIMGITSMARHEATGGTSPTLYAGLVFTAAGSAALAFAPRIADNPALWHVSPSNVFPFMIGVIAFPVVLRGARAIIDPTPVKIQSTIRVGVMTIIPLAASFALLGAGPTWGICVLSLMIPAVILATRFRVT